MLFASESSDLPCHSGRVVTVVVFSSMRHVYKSFPFCSAEFLCWRLSQVISDGYTLTRGVTMAIKELHNAHPLDLKFCRCVFVCAEGCVCGHSQLYTEGCV